MNSRVFPAGLVAGVWLVVVATCVSAPALRRVVPAVDADAGAVRLVVHAGRPAGSAIPRYLTGKFAEHLGRNIYNGMDAQILRNPTFADYPFRAGPMSPDGLARFHWEPESIAEALRREGRRSGWPETALEALTRDSRDGLAALWSRTGPVEAVRPSPDTGPAGGRAQRVQVRGGGQGIGQWTWLPLHRVREFEIEVYGRSPEVRRLMAVLTVEGQQEPSARCVLTGLKEEWGRLQGRLELPANAPADVRYRLDVTAERAGQFVLRYVFLRPVDHVGGADPDVVRLLRESRLPLLRWPGGNFVSSYHWRDGVGPIERRPTRPNFAWGGVEPNTFGTDEFIAFCRAVGCEPMICVNAGTGTPEEAARWVEYCNGGLETPMGALRARYGHPEPYGVRHWEVGNELWGRWQAHWTTAEGYVDRFRRFAAAMRAADPTITLYACGAPVFWGREWNKTLFAGAGSLFRHTTDHPLIGGTLSRSTDPRQVYLDFMAVPEVLHDKWAELRRSMKRAGIRDPRLAVTELQLFPHLADRPAEGKPRLSPQNLVRQDSITEALYDVLVYHAAVRLGDFVTLVTHSATVNHGGGLRKERERVWANPCYYARKLFADFTGARPVPVTIECALQQAPRVLPDLRGAASEVRFALVDALAARDGQGQLWVSLVHRGVDRPLEVTIELEDLPGASSAEADLLGASLPWEGNRFETPDRVVPRHAAFAVREGRLRLQLQPYTWVRLRIAP